MLHCQAIYNIVYINKMAFIAFEKSHNSKCMRSQPVLQFQCLQWACPFKAGEIAQNRFIIFIQSYLYDWTSILIL